ncbi:antigen 5 like allergen Cul n 1-like [Bradysia coprophila]|uniref:antigen 5 like allergen Cul n 1-like n=1 Tax=Bradysia coprophila TaxID=38358 RepID=UPI00187DD348|nr:antigen 5 like allergen Cul n 1-like [Bradysia coprophila]
MQRCNSLLLFVLLTIVSATIAVDYCSTALCSAQNHIGCGNTGDFGPKCLAERSVVPMTADIIALILQRHNTARVNVANGKVSPFLTANKMIEMSWDSELASIAAMNAKTCVFAHDKCRNTAIFKYAGQNIAMTSSSPNYKDTVAAINQLFDLWYNEYVDCNMDQITKLTTITAANGNSFGHFTQIVMANSSKIGCAIVNYLANSWKNTYLVCNYAQTNMISWPVYTSGTPCSGCKSGCSTTYPGLCNANEVVSW